MEINDGEQASEVVKAFLEKMGWSIFATPESAGKTDGQWEVVFIVGFKRMKFQVSASNGRILRYETVA